MFGDDVIAQYIESQTKTDTLAACRAVAQQCFDDFGGTNYENFYTPNSGLFTADVVDTAEAVDKKTALDWFTLYEYDENGTRLPGYKSICAQRVADIASCADQIEEVFGGLDMVIAQQSIQELGRYKYFQPTGATDIHAYGWAMRDAEGNIPLSDWVNSSTAQYKFQNRRLRPTGVATEVYNRIVDSLITQCTNVDGRFVEAQFIDHRFYSTCILDYNELDSFYQIISHYGIHDGFLENVCPKDYMLNIDTAAWGICSCWENGGRRSMAGESGKCAPLISTDNHDDPEVFGIKCSNYASGDSPNTNDGLELGFNDWCTSQINSETNQVCPFDEQDENCDVPDGVPGGILN